MNYTAEFERDFTWFLNSRREFSFCGKEISVQSDSKGVSAKEAFLKYDRFGKILSTKQPNILKNLLQVKGSVNLHIKMWAEDRAKDLLPDECFNTLIKELNLLPWMITAVEKQKLKYNNKN